MITVNSDIFTSLYVRNMIFTYDEKKDNCWYGIIIMEDSTENLFYSYDHKGFVEAVLNKDKSNELIINEQTIVSGEYTLKNDFLAEQFLHLAIKNNSLSLLEKVLDYYQIPNHNMNTKERLSYFYIFNEKRKES